jgi:glycosidase
MLRRAAILALLGVVACGAHLGDAALTPGVPDGGSAPSPPVASSAPAPLDAERPGTIDAWKSQVIYLVVPDRFQNGDPSNDTRTPPNCFDPANPGKFHGGDLAGLRQSIPYLKDLGVTAVWVLPQYAQSPDRCGYHGYWADFTDPDDGAIEPGMGGAVDLHGLVDDLHAAGMRFVLDMVVNHAGRAARVVSQHPDWFHDPSTCASLGDRQVYCPIGGSPLPDFAQEKPDVAAYLTAMSVGWATRFGIDAVRMDTVKHVPVAYWKAWTQAMRGVRSDMFMVGEVFDEGPAANLAPFLDAGFTSLFDYPLYGAIVATFARGGSVDGVADKVKEGIATYGAARMRMMTSFLGNHDNPRFTSLVPAGTPEAEVVQREHLALGAVFTLPGIPQLYYGDEIALYGGKDPDNRRDMPSWAWTPEGRASAHAGEAAGAAQATYAFTQKLVGLRKARAALADGSYVETWRQGGTAGNVLGFLRSTGSDRVVVVINEGAGATTVSMRIQTSGALPPEDRAALADGKTLVDLLGEGAPSEVTLGRGVMALTMPGRTMGIYAAK